MLEQTKARIARFLGCQLSDIVRIERWKTCFLVIARGLRPIFVSHGVLLCQWFAIN